MKYVPQFPSRIIRVKEAPPEFFDQYSILESPGLDSVTEAMLPPLFSLRGSMTPVKDQGGAGTCTSFGVIACLEFFHQVDLSESHLTHQAERTFGDCTEGLAIAHAMQTANNPGAVQESVWGYDDRQICWSSPPDVGPHTKYRFGAIENVFYRPGEAVVATIKKQLEDKALSSLIVRQAIPGNFVARVKAVLANARHPVALDVPVWWKSSGYFDAGWDFGSEIKMPTPVNLKLWMENNAASTSPPNVDGWHVIAICGYNDATGRFEFKNSWSRWWGDQGYGTIPYDYITQYSRLAMHGWV